MEYETLTLEDELGIARDALRGRESDHYRISLLNEPSKPERLAGIEADVGRIRAEIARLEAEIQRPGPPE